MTNPAAFIYIAGKVRDPNSEIQIANTEAAARFAAWVMDNEHIPTLCGPVNTRGLAPYLKDTFTTETAMDFVRPFVHNAIAVYVLCLPGWEQSTGTAAEIAYAQSLNIPVHYYAPNSAGTYTRQ